ncbi:MAG TPA: AMP-binding protein, partial [Longimicrobium sp.]|nr:AMP-binding protein [Longimicrobium sp.]
AGTVPLAAEGARCGREPAGPDDMAYIYFTSGSTGAPKGIAGRHRGVHHFVLWEAGKLELGAGVRVSQLTTPSFDAFLRDVFVPLSVAGTVCAPPSREVVMDARRLVDWVHEARVEVLHCVPSLFRTVVNEATDPALFPALRWVLLAGEPLLPADVKRWSSVFGERIRLGNLYGPSETTMVKFFYPVTPADGDRRFVPVGRPIEGAAAVVVDTRGRACAPGTIGEILIRTPYRSLGYYRRPDLTAEVFVPNPLGSDPADLVYRTGDFGRVLEGGDFEFLGRRDAQVKIRGVRVEVQEVESLLRSHPEVGDVAVVDRDDGEGNKILCAYVVSPGEVEPLRDFVAARLPETMVPSVFMAVAELPRTLNGKVDRKALPAPGELRRGERLLPRTPVEEALAGIWREVLGSGEVDVRDHFFRVGGHSLMATRVMARVRDVFGVEMPLREFFDAPTLEGLAGRVERLRGEAAGDGIPPVSPVSRAGPLPLSFAQERLWLVAQMQGDGNAYNTPTSLRLRGVLDWVALERAVGEIARRHETLRTRFEVVDGLPAQVVDPWIP